MPGNEQRRDTPVGRFSRVASRHKVVTADRGKSYALCDRRDRSEGWCSCDPWGRMGADNRIPFEQHTARSGRSIPERECLALGKTSIALKEDQDVCR